ncbi:hypothetical protein PSEWESI4_03358 [Pseudomonas carbonaria]|uniref:Uncharacterized protein n=1 Tax=Zestomonas carbonaria TaxID=2762745 RepID=A0A7U7IBM0_9GAMM|nr:hypothetical protein PSEWESI4_03358 [Pseudomonas carbonaria]
MSSRQGRVIRLQQWNPERALEDLNRLTGLRFSRWPDSLVETGTVVEGDVGEQPACDEPVSPREVARG